MSKILGDNPFDDDLAEPAGDAGPADGGDGAAAEAPDAATAAPRPPTAPTPDPTAPVATTVSDAAAPTDLPRRDRAQRIQTAQLVTEDDDGEDPDGVPDAFMPDDDSGWVSGDGDDVFLGEEAVVPPGDYGPVRSYQQTRHDQDVELRELERRVDAQGTPVFPLDFKRRLPLEFVWKRWRQLAMMGRSDVVDDFGRDPRATARWEPLLDFLYSRWFRVETTGLEHIPARGRALLVGNHAGTMPYDSAMVMHAVRRDHPARRDVRPLVEDAVFHLPFLGPLINRIGGVRACPENAERLLAKDELVAVFPEGVKGMGKLWRDRYRLQRFGRGGFVKLALRSRAPIIPVAIVGAEEAVPMLGKITWFTRNIGLSYIPVTPTFPWLGPIGLLPLPSKWHVAMAPPIDLAAEYGPEAAEDRLLVNRLADGIRSQLQQMVDDLRTKRRSLFR